MRGVAQLAVIAPVAASFAVQIKMQDAFDLGRMTVRAVGGGMRMGIVSLWPGGMARCLLPWAAVVATLAGAVVATAGALTPTVLPIRFSERSLVQRRPRDSAASMRCLRDSLAGRHRRQRYRSFGFLRMRRDAPSIHNSIGIR
jgi:hypothetical protein